MKPGNQPSAFAVQHRHDRLFYLGFAVVAWAVVIIGFGPGLLDRLQGRLPPPPLILHAHAAAFAGWLALFTTQTLVIKAHRIELHKKLGLIGAALAVVMVYLGIATALAVHRERFEAGHGERISFLIVQIMGMAIFATCVTLALVLRKNPSAHKRLMVLATIELLGAGFGRSLERILMKQFGSGLIGFPLALFAGGYGLILLAMLYDFGTRRRIHPVYLVGLPAMMAAHLLMSVIFHHPAWRLVVQRLIGH